MFRSILLPVCAACLLFWLSPWRALMKPAARPETAAAQVVAMPATDTAPAAIALHADANGHFRTQAVVDGRSLPMMVDTGASLCAFSEEDAARIGLRVGPNDFSRPVATANGTIRVAPVRIGAIQIGPVTVRDVEAVVIPRGRLGTNLLGMSFLKKVREFSVAGGRLTIRG